MRNEIVVTAATFKALFNELLTWQFICSLLRRCGVLRRCSPRVTAVELIQSIFYKELKVDTRSTPLLKSHTPLTATQEIATLIIAYAVLVDYRMKAASVAQVGVLRISFLKTLQIVQGLWQFLEVTSDMLTPAQVNLVVQRALKQVANMAIPKRRVRSCPRKLRQPVSSWPRLRKNTYKKGSVDYSVNEIHA
jgi:hypothetical protein